MNKKKLFISLGMCLLVVLFIIAFLYDIKVEKVAENDVKSPIKKMSNDEILTQVLNGEKELIDYDGNEILISDLKIDGVNTSINQYTFLDMDGDNKNELVSITDSYYGYYLILHIENNVIYGYNVNINDMDLINKSGLIYDKTEEGCTYSKIKFIKNKFKFMNVASFNNGQYLIDKEESNEEEFKVYEEEFLKDGIVNYKSNKNNWMAKTLSNTYSIESKKDFKVSTEKLDFLFLTDSEVESFNNELLENKFNLYFINSNGRKGKINIIRKDDNLEETLKEIDSKDIIGVYDENSQFVILINKNDYFGNGLLKSYDYYYFKYYNKDIQFIGNYNSLNSNDILNEEFLNNIG